MEQRRYLANFIETFTFRYQKMAFVSGPRQVGKTTLAKKMLSENKVGAYGNWDDKDFRKFWVKGPTNTVERMLGPFDQSKTKPLLVLDELHKDKNFLVTSKGKPIFSCECKLSDQNLDPSFLSFARQLKLKYHIQIVAKSGILHRTKIDDTQVLTISAAKCLSYFV